MPPSPREHASSLRLRLFLRVSPPENMPPDRVCLLHKSVPHLREHTSDWDHVSNVRTFLLSESMILPECVSYLKTCLLPENMPPLLEHASYPSVSSLREHVLPENMPPLRKHASSLRRCLLPDSSLRVCLRPKSMFPPAFPIQCASIQKDACPHKTHEAICGKYCSTNNPYDNHSPRGNTQFSRTHHSKLVMCW